ncbi:MAG: SAM-dependent methyltransferase, partial [Actinoplanes sp.]
LPSFDSGILVVENHGNAESLRHLRARRHDGQRWFAELSHDQVAKLMARHGFEIVERRGFSMLTPSLHGHAIARAADAAVRRLPGTDAYAVNVLYTARRVSQ